MRVRVQVLVCIWARILAFDATCRTDLVKDNAYVYFITHLSGSDVQPEQRVMATFILTVIMDDNRAGQRDCLKKSVHRTCAQFLLSKETERMPVFRRWLCLALGKLCIDHQDARHACLREDLHLGLLMLLTSCHVEVRVAAVYALGTLFGIVDSSRSSSGGGQYGSNTSLSSLNMSMTGLESSGGGGGERSPPSLSSRQWSTSSAASSLNGQEHEAKRRVDVAVVAVELLRAFDDASPMVRREAVLSLYLLLTDPLHYPYFTWVAHELILFNQEHATRQQQQQQKQPPPAPATSGPGSSSSPPRPSSSSADRGTSAVPSQPLDSSETNGNGPHAASNGVTSKGSGRGSSNGPSRGGSPDEVAAARRADWFATLSARLTAEGGDIAEHYLRVWLALRQVRAGCCSPEL